MLKKVIVGIVLLMSFFFSQVTLAKENVRWDGSEIVEGQIGKMTFSKNVKVYKKNEDGSFSSLVVKKNDFFRVYSKEMKGEYTYLWMSGGYRVQLTDLVVYKEVPKTILEQVSGSPFFKGEYVFASSKSGISMKVAPDSNAETSHRFPAGTVFTVQDFVGDYVKVGYKGDDFTTAGYVAENFIASLPLPKTNYVKETTKIDKQLNFWNSRGIYRGDEIKVYFNTADGYSYVAHGERAGFIRTSAISSVKISSVKIVDIPLSKIENPEAVAFDPLKEIEFHYDGHHNPDLFPWDSSTSGNYSVLSPGIWSGLLSWYVGEATGYRQSKFVMQMNTNELTYVTDSRTIKISFPLVVGSKIKVKSSNSSEITYTVEKMVEEYTSNGEPYFITDIVENAVIAYDSGDKYPLIIGKNYIRIDTDIWIQE